MRTWDYFKYRWDRMQSADINDNKKDIGHLQLQVLALEQMMIYLLGRLSLEKEISLEDPVLKDFMHLKDVDDPERAVREIIGQFSGRHEKKFLVCTRCGAKVRDVEGIYDEVCSWCGEQLESEY